MPEASGWFGWVDWSNERQVTWVTNQLLKRGVRLPTGVTPEHQIRLLDEAWSASEDAITRLLGTELIRKLRNAWRSHKRRSQKTGNKAYSFEMSKGASVALRRLAAGRHINRTEPASFS